MCEVCMGRRGVLAGMIALCAGRAAAVPAPRLPRAVLLEPHMRMTEGVALTLDCCDGGVDDRILDVLLRERIPATLFVSGKWLKHNSLAMDAVLAAPDLFEIGNHGARHLMCVDEVGQDWGVPAAGSAQAVSAEITDGARLLQAAGAAWPGWYRGAAALYTAGGLAVAQGLGWRIAGFSLNGDAGASLGAAEVARRYAAAVAGDVIISHLNQPHRAAGAGVAKGILALRNRGVRFVRLSDPGNVFSAV
jgi:peptidoglycan/xylan/chitin deacetylase (PgdA/CDA1 family)